MMRLIHSFGAVRDTSLAKAPDLQLSTNHNQQTLWTHSPTRIFVYDPLPLLALLLPNDAGRSALHLRNCFLARSLMMR
jgi:hypothetical protein